MMDEQMNVLGAPKKIVDGLVEVFEGFARMFEGVSEQLELLAEDAVETLEDKPAFPAKELLPAKGSGKKGAAVTRPRKNPEKKNRKGDTAPVADDAAPADADTAEDTVKDTKTAAEETPPDSTDSNLQADTEDGLPWEEDTGQKEAAALTADNQLKSAPTDQSATTITKDDITAVIVAKIKQKRDNNAKIGQLLKAYGYSELSALPAEKYEAFLADISQL